MITFDAKNHIYQDEKGFIIPSVTEVLSEVYGTGLENAPIEMVQRAAEKGSKIHKEIELFINGQEAEQRPMPETINFMKYANENLRLDIYAKTEEIVYCCTPYGTICGTADLFCNGWLYDFKTSKTATRVQIDKWQKQLSFYYYMLKSAGKSVLGMKVLHLTENACDEIELEYLGDDFILETMKLYKEGKKAGKPTTTELQTVSQKELAIFKDILCRIKTLENSIEPIKEAIKAEMEQRNILALDFGDVSISYIAPSKRKSFDSVRFKAEHSDLYNAYQKESTVKSSIRIKVN